MSPTVLTSAVLASLPLPSYGSGASKLERGKLLVVGGSREVPGAALLAARAALRIGCGTVRVAVPAAVAAAVAVAQPELMVLALPERDGRLDAGGALDVVEPQYGACDALVVGPGMADDEAAAHLARQVVAHAPLPAVVDAGALLAWSPGERRVSGAFEATAGPRVFTPHAGEMCQLAGCDEAQLAADRAGVARAFVAERRATLVLKGEETLIASPGGPTYLNMAGSRALGTAGSGDALAGAIGGLLAQGLDPSRAAVWGVRLHALAGELAAAEIGEDGVLAMEVVDRLPRVLREARHPSCH